MAGSSILSGPYEGRCDKVPGALQALRSGHEEPFLANSSITCPDGDLHGGRFAATSICGRYAGFRGPRLCFAEGLIPRLGSRTRFLILERLHCWVGYCIDRENRDAETRVLLSYRRLSLSRSFNSSISCLSSRNSRSLKTK